MRRARASWEAGVERGPPDPGLPGLGRLQVQPSPARGKADVWVTRLPLAGEAVRDVGSQRLSAWKTRWLVRDVSMALGTLPDGENGLHL